VAGGSGGHIFPAIAVAKKMRQKKQNIKIEFWCSRGKLDQKIFSSTDENFNTIFSGKWRRYFSWQNFIDPIFVFLGFWESFFKLIFARPKAIFSKGGFVSVPVVFAGWILRIPIILHESDSIPGLANRICSKFATHIFSAFPGKFGKLSGLPIDLELFSSTQKKIKIFSDQKPIVLFFGGSQGSNFLDKIFLQISENFLNTTNFILITNNTKIKITHKNQKIFSLLPQKNFFQILQNSQIVVSRSGSSIFEIAAAEKPAILIPHEFGGGNHQKKNAEILENFGAAKIFSQQDFDFLSFKNFLQKLLENKNLQNELSKKIKKFAPKNAAEKIAEKILIF